MSDEIKKFLKNKENNVIDCRDDFNYTTDEEYYAELEAEGKKFVHFYFSEETEEMFNNKFFNTCIINGKEMIYTQEIITDNPNRPKEYNHEHPEGIDLVMTQDQVYLGYGETLSKNNVYENKESIEFEKLSEEEKLKSVYFAKEESNVVNIFNKKKRRTP